MIDAVVVTVFSSPATTGPLVDSRLVKRAS